VNQVSILVALGAGLLSFLSPCVLPLIPGYLSFISGAGADEIKAGSKRAGVFYRTLFSCSASRRCSWVWACCFQAAAC